MRRRISVSQSRFLRLRSERVRATGSGSWGVDCSDAFSVTSGTVTIGGLGGFGSTVEIAVTFSEQAGIAHGARHLAETGIGETEARALR